MSPVASREPLPGPARAGELVWSLPTRRATIRFARRLAAACRLGDLLVLSGDLGVGKTFLTRAICRGLDVPQEETITSPSFVLVHEIDGRIPILHVDLYRLGDDSEVLQLGLGERREDSLMIVEWGVPYVAALGGAALHIELTHLSEGRRARMWSEGAEDAFARASESLGADPGRHPDAAPG